MIAKYLARASVALPFLLALGFATAAITSMLVERFGSIAGYWMVAGGLTLIGLVAALVVGVKEQEEEEVAEKRAEASDTAEVGADAAAQAAVQMPLAALGSSALDAWRSNRCRGRRKDAGAQSSTRGASGADQPAVLAERSLQPPIRKRGSSECPTARVRLQARTCIARRRELPHAMESERKDRAQKLSFSDVARWTSNALGRPQAFMIACAAVVVWALTGPIFRLLRHLAAGHQHRHHHRHLPHGVPDPEHPEPRRARASTSSSTS